MFKLEKLNGKAVLTIYGYVGGYYLEPRNISSVLDEVARSGYKQLDLHIHTNGGDVFEGNLILNLIKAFKGRIDIYVDGIAASMGAIICGSVPPEQVHIADNGFLMIHSPVVGVCGNFRELIAGAKLLRSIEKTFKASLSKILGKTADEIELQYFDGVDHWIDADEAISLGLAGDKFTVENGAVTFSKSEAATAGVQSVINRYSKLIPQNIINQSLDEMKIVNSTLKLADNATEPEAVAAIKALEKTASDAIAERDEAKRKEDEATAALNLKLTEIENKQKEAAKAEATSLIAEAVRDGRIDDDKDHKAVGFWEKSFERDHEDAKAALALLPKHKSIASNLQNGKGESAWDKRQKEIDDNAKK